MIDIINGHSDLLRGGESFKFRCVNGIDDHHVEVQSLWPIWFDLKRLSKYLQWRSTYNEVDDGNFLICRSTYNEVDDST
jgi:hypothetical protein